jgi:Flp pilus assembly protein TadG
MIRPNRHGTNPGWVTTMFKRLLHDRSAGVAPLLGLCIIPMVGAVGAAIDYSRAASVRTSMQMALDSTALMLSKEAQGLDTAQLGSKATAYFNALFHRPETNNVQITQEFGSPALSTFSLKITGTTTLPTVFWRVLGTDHVDITATGEVLWGIKKLNLALALDNTGSMSSNNKMTELQKAAHTLLTTLKNAEKTPGDIKISIIPFDTDVNVGTGNVNASWIDWTEWEAPPANSMPPANVGPGSSCPWTNGSNGFRCTTGPANGSSNTNTIPSSGNICPSINNNNGTYYNGCYNSTNCTGSGSTLSCQHAWVTNARSTWNGCVYDRDQNYDALNTATGGGAATNYRAHQASNCPTSMMALSTDWTALNSKIDAMTPVGNTNVTIGLQLAWQSVSPVAPFNAPAPAPDLDKVIILLTDGDNTQNRWSSTQSVIDARTDKVCTNAKADNIKIYTIRVINGNASLLKSCATKPDMYYEVAQATQLNSVFTAIAQNLANLRIAK